MRRVTYIVASLVERSISGVADSSHAAFRSGADLVEIRLDYLRLATLDVDSLGRVREAVNGPAIATLRSSKEGGQSRLRANARRAALEKILEAGFEYVDLELETDSMLLGRVKRRKKRPVLIASSHLKRIDSENHIEGVLKRACKAADIGKVAAPCRDATEALMLARVGMRHSLKGERFTLIGMGDQGKLTRACARQIGSSMVYCCIPGKPAAPGQLDIATQHGLYRRDRIVIGLLGHPVGHSVSEHMQGDALSRAGMRGVYLNLDVKSENLDRSTLETLRTLGFEGVNVTIPHKAAVFELCDETGGAAAATKAVNTIKFTGSVIYGENTDVIGFWRMIEGKTRIRVGAPCLVVGAGGAARAAAFVLVKMGADVIVAGKRLKKAKEVASIADATAVELPFKGAKKSAYEIVVNCTPLGTKGIGGQIPVPAWVFGKGTVFFDLVYNPPVTKSMKIATARGAKAYNGLDMLVRQGAESFRIWTGEQADADSMRAAARRALG